MSRLLLTHLAAMDDPKVIGAVFAILMGFSLLLLLVKRYKRCPSNKILVVYGKVGGGGASKCIHGGGAFIWPLIQDYDYLDLEPIQIEIPLRGALSIENIRVNVPSVFTVAIGTEPAAMNNASVRLLGLREQDVQSQARDIIFGQLRQVIASMRIEEINRDRDSFLERIQQSLEPELKKIGLVLINVNITDITDESGYIEAIGRKAAATAIQQAEIDVADQERKGAVGVAQANRSREVEVANAHKERDIGTKSADKERLVQVAILDKETKIGEQTAGFQRDSEVADAEREKRIRVADADARAVEGENQSKAKIAKAEATLQVERAEAYQQGETRKRVAEADVLKAQYIAQAEAAKAEAAKVEQEKMADLVAPALAQKARVVVEAEAEAERRRIEAEGDAKAIYARLEAEARGQYEILAKKGQGFGEIVRACETPQAAFQMLMLEKLERLSENAAKAISNIKFDKVVVWDGGKDAKGGSATSNFLSSMAGALPPMLHMMRDIGGVEMPEFFGKLVDDAVEKKMAGEDTPPPSKGGRPKSGDAT
ncbi:MAG: SPFH domain-containing protein [Planctomycetota bacterium]|nr:SPFH domain-containing protein [Planctomycetota bacterium]